MLTEICDSGTSLRNSSYMTAICVLLSDPKTRVICGELKAFSRLGSDANALPPASTVRPDIAAAGNAAAATTTPARAPQISSEVAFVRMLWSRRRNQEDTRAPYRLFR